MFIVSGLNKKLPTEKTMALSWEIISVSFRVSPKEHQGNPPVRQMNMKRHGKPWYVDDTINVGMMWKSFSMQREPVKMIEMIREWYRWHSEMVEGNEGMENLKEMSTSIYHSLLTSDNTVADITHCIVCQIRLVSDVSTLYALFN
jgi:hypothetical protein